MDSHLECSQPKKSKSCIQNKYTTSDWAYLPSVVLYQILDYLTTNDRINASSICRHWRKHLYHPKFWRNVTFRIDYEMPKAKFVSQTFGRNVSNATIAFDTLSPLCIREFMTLLRRFTENNHLKTLILEPSHCQIEQSNGLIQSREILELILSILPKIEKFSLGCLEFLATSVDQILRALDGEKVTLLGLASVKYDIAHYEECYFDPLLISAFTNLKILSIDYDQLTDTFLYNLKSTKLERLIVHLHAIPDGHPGTTNKAWKDFKVAHPQCEMRLNAIHAYAAIDDLHVKVMHEDMPISHLKVFFCEDINITVLQNLSTFYMSTLRSLIWIDSLSDDACTWKLTERRETPDPLILMSWHCKKLEEIVLYGYKYPEYSLVGIGRLKGSKMKNLEVSSFDILPTCKFGSDADKDIVQNIGDAWNPMHLDDLHPVLINPNNGDSDEFLLPYVQADLH